MRPFVQAKGGRCACGLTRAFADDWPVDQHVLPRTPRSCFYGRRHPANPTTTRGSEAVTRARANSISFYITLAEAVPSPESAGDAPSPLSDLRFAAVADSTPLGAAPPVAFGAGSPALALEEEEFGRASGVCSKRQQRSTAITATFLLPQSHVPAASSLPIRGRACGPGVAPGLLSSGGNVRRWHAPATVSSARDRRAVTGTVLR